MSTKYNHKEAFCLMTYLCPKCGHREVLWNSRDGVTPFMIPCSKCESHEMAHINFYHDLPAPNHVPKVGQRIFTDLTVERAKFYAERQFNHIIEKRPDFLAERNTTQQKWTDNIAADFYGDGRSPDIVTVVENTTKVLTPVVDTKQSPWFKPGTFISSVSQGRRVFSVVGTGKMLGTKEDHYILTSKLDGSVVYSIAPVASIDSGDYVCCGGILPSLLRDPVVI